MTHPLSIADLPVYIWLRSHVYRSYPHIALHTMQTRTQSLALCSTRSLSLHCLYLCEGFPNVQLNKSYATTPNVLHADRKTDTQKRAKLDLGYLFDDLKHLLTKTFHFEA